MQNDEKRSVEIVKEIQKLDEGHEERMERWEEKDRVCVNLQRELDHARFNGRGLKEAYTAFHQAQWDRDREKHEIDLKRRSLCAGLGQLNRNVVSDAIGELDGALEGAAKKRVRESVKDVPFGPWFGRRTVTARSNDPAFFQILCLVNDGKNKLTSMRETASIPQIREFFKNILEKVLSVSMEPIEYEVGNSVFSPLDKEPAKTASAIETFKAKQAAEYAELTREVEVMRKEVKGMIGR